MSQVLSVDWEKVIQGAFTGIAMFGTWAFARRKNNAETTSDIAAANASTSASEAASTLYDRLREEIDALRNDVNRLRSDLDIERRHSRRLELHVWKLERIMRAGGLEPPEFIDEDATNPITGVTLNVSTSNGN